LEKEAWHRYQRFHLQETSLIVADKVISEGIKDRDEKRPIYISLWSAFAWILKFDFLLAVFCG